MFIGETICSHTSGYRNISFYRSHTSGYRNISFYRSGSRYRYRLIKFSRVILDMIRPSESSPCSATVTRRPAHVCIADLHRFASCELQTATALLPFKPNSKYRISHYILCCCLQAGIILKVAYSVVSFFTLYWRGTHCVNWTMSSSKLLRQVIKSAKAPNPLGPYRYGFVELIYAQSVGFCGEMLVC